MPIAYFDNAASTRVDPRVLEAITPFFSESYANPSALHSMALEARAAVEHAREEVAELFGAEDPSEVIFTCGATEANNTVLRSCCGTILASAIEHPSVRNPVQNCDRGGLIPVDSTGAVLFDELDALLKGEPGLVSVMLVNNEIGTTQDIDKIGSMAKAKGWLLHSDVTQAVGKQALNLSERPVDYATLSGHKFHAPKGIGALWVRAGAPLTPHMVGGTHEAFRRAGTLNVPGAIGLGVAARLMVADGADETTLMASQRERIIKSVQHRIPDVKLNGQEKGAPHIISLSFFRTEGESVIINLDARGICCTAGAACSSGTKAGSHVLHAIGLPEEWLRGTVRISLSRFTTDQEIDLLLDVLEESVRTVRNSVGYASV